MLYIFILHFRLIVALARDLQYEFYPHFPKFFSAIVSQLSTQDTELLEKLFMCLAYLFKFLWKYMVKDIENVYRYYTCINFIMYIIEFFGVCYVLLKLFALYIYQIYKKNIKTEVAYHIICHSENLVHHTVLHF